MDPATPEQATSASPAGSPAQTVPSTWPGAFGIYKYSRSAILRNVWLLVMIWVVYFALSFALGLVHRLGMLAWLVSVILGALVTAMVAQIVLAGVRGQQVTYEQAFSGDLPMLTLKMLGLQILVSFAAFVSLLALIVPFFFVYPRLSLATYFLVDKNMGVLDAFTASWRATQGNVGKVWGIIGASFLMGLLMLTLIGIPVAIYLLVMYSAANAVLYVYLSSHQPAAPAPAA